VKEGGSVVSRYAVLVLGVVSFLSTSSSASNTLKEGYLCPWLLTVNKKVTSPAAMKEAYSSVKEEVTSSSLVFKWVPNHPIDFYFWSNIQEEDRIENSALRGVEKKLERSYYFDEGTYYTLEGTKEIQAYLDQVKSHLYKIKYLALKEKHEEKVTPASGNAAASAGLFFLSAILGAGWGLGMADGDGYFLVGAVTAFIAALGTLPSQEITTHQKTQYLEEEFYPLIHRVLYLMQRNLESTSDGSVFMAIPMFDENTFEMLYEKKNGEAKLYLRLAPPIRRPKEVRQINVRPSLGEVWAVR